jgi:hypothetical protein
MCIAPSLVKKLTAYGVRQEFIAQEVGVSRKTLQTHYREEIDLGAARANAQMAEALYKKAIEGDTTCMIFWLKTRAGWSERFIFDQSSLLKVISDRPMTTQEFDEQFCVGPSIDVPFDNA